MEEGQLIEIVKRFSKRESDGKKNLTPLLKIFFKRDFLIKQSTQSQCLRIFDETYSPSFSNMGAHDIIIDIAPFNGTSDSQVAAIDAYRTNIVRSSVPLQKKKTFQKTHCSDAQGRYTTCRS